MKKLSRSSKRVQANYHADINSDLCIGCGTCVERCQINAVKIVDDLEKIILKRCIGCGVCVPTCPEEVIQLKRKDPEIIPLQSKKELYTMIMDKKQQLRSNNK